MKILITIILSIFISTCYAVDRKEFSSINLKDILKDTQAQPDNAGDKHLSLVWWVPYEYWASVFSRDPNISEDIKKEILGTLEDYTIIAIVQSDISAFGAFSFYPKDFISKNLKVTYTNANKKISKITPSLTYSDDLKLILSEVTPVLKAAMGNMGANFNFYIFNDIGDKGKRILDPYKNGRLEVSLKKQSGEDIHVSFQTPLNSLFHSRICPNGMPAHISWKYCPWSGKKL